MRILGWLASAVGLVGVVVANGLASLVWVARRDLRGRVGDLLSLPDAGLEIAGTLVGGVSGLLDEAAADVGGIRTQADVLAATPVADPAAATALATAIDELVQGPYATLRTSYAVLRERALSAGDALAGLRRAIPVLGSATPVADRLEALDARLLEVDESVTRLSQLGPAGLAEPAVASQVAERAGVAAERLASIGELLTAVEDWTADARTRVVAADRRAARLLTAGAVAGTVVSLFVAGLNVLLFQQGRRWSRGPVQGGSGGSRRSG